jgi:hypothetical protein
MKFQRIPVLALAALLVTAGACGEQQVLETKGAAKVASASDHLGSADAFEHRTLAANVASPKYVDMVHDALDAKYGTVNGPKHLGSADAIEHRVTSGLDLDWERQQYIDAIARMTPEELAATYGNVFKGKTLPRPDVLAAQVQQSIQAKAYVDGIARMSPEQLAAAFGYTTSGAATP